MTAADQPPAIIRPADPAPGTLEAGLEARASDIEMVQRAMAQQAHDIAQEAIRQAASLRVEVRMLEAENLRLREELANKAASRRTLVRSEPDSLPLPKPPTAVLPPMKEAGFPPPRKDPTGRQNQMAQRGGR